jgi:hypothetical protein
MKIVWIASLALAASGAAIAQSTIYKHVDESGRTTYSNKPMKGATVVDLEPLTIMQAGPAVAPGPQKSNFTLQQPEKPEEKQAQGTDAPRTLKPAVAIVTPIPSLASIQPDVQKRRDNDRRRILEEELSREEQSLTDVRNSVASEQMNPQLVAAVRAAQQATDPSASQLAEFRNNIEKASGRIRGLQATAAEHEKNIEALKKEIGALKP